MCIRDRYGAIGTSGATKPYPMSKWPSIYNEKIRKGYIHLPNQPMYQRPSKNSGGPKYGFTGETRIIPGTTRTAYRIVSRIDFTAGDGSEVHAGDKGGWAEQDGLLSQNVDDSSWVADEAILYGEAVVKNDAVIKMCIRDRSTSDQRAFATRATQSAAKRIFFLSCGNSRSTAL